MVVAVVARLARAAKARTTAKPSLRLKMIQMSLVLSMKPCEHDEYESSALWSSTPADTIVSGDVSLESFVVSAVLLQISSMMPSPLSAVIHSSTLLPVSSMLLQLTSKSVSLR